MRRRRKRKAWGIFFLWLICILPVLPVFAATGDGTIYGNPYIGFSPDNQAFTTNPGDQAVEWYEKGTTVETGITSSLRDLQTGEHYYELDYKRTGSVPVGKWTVAYMDHTCIHNNYSPEFHGVDFTRNNGCAARNYSGWMATCADCGEVFTKGFIYMSQDAAKSLKYIDVSKDYYYLCPFDKNLEQGYTFKHQCKGISWNKYLVKYMKNGATGGYMASTTHMYNNTTLYEGKEIIPDTKLRTNLYTKLGYEFIGWNTKTDGTGTWYRDKQEIKNLTNIDLNENANKATIFLYAQWKKTTSTLEIDPAGGIYQNTSSLTTMTQDYGTTYIPDLSKLQAPAGATVSFVDPATGNAVAPSITGTQSFKEWQLNSDFKGKFQNGIYTFQGPQDHVDRLTAVYTRNSITLPSVSKENASFAGWYYDEAGNNLAGYAGDEITPDQDVTVYAKWVSLLLTATDDYTSNHQKGAVDLVWIQPDMQQKTYIVKQCRQGGSWTKLTSSTEADNNLSVAKDFAFTKGTQTYQAPYTGFYTLTASGAQGGNFGTNTGGLGGRASGKFFLTAGENLTITIGGQDGYNGGGTGQDYGSNGGGYTVVSSDLKGILLMAGGGGGAAVNGNGNAGGSAASLIESGNTGESGKAGGGGGAQGGKAGEYIVHNHTADCYVEKTTGYELFYNPQMDGGKTEDIRLSSEYRTYLSKWGTATNDAQGKAYIYGANGAIMDGKQPYAFGGSGKSGNANAYYTVNLGMYDYDYKNNRNQPYYYYFPTNGCDTLVIDAYADAWGYAVELKGSSFAVYDQNENIIASKSYDGLREYTNPSETDFNANASTSGYLHYKDSNSNTYKVRYKEEIKLPEGTAGIRIVLSEAVWGLGNYGTWFNKISFKKDYKELACDYAAYEDGYVVSSKPAYGGSNYIYTDIAASYANESGKQEGNGTFTLRGENLGYQMASRLDDVAAPDLAAPDAPVIAEKMDAVGTDWVQVIWSKPQDHGTLYYHQVTSYVLQGGSLTENLNSNITENTLTTGVKGYYYLLSDSRGHVPSASWDFLPDSQVWLDVGLKEASQYLHVAAVDVAGNISAVSIKEIPPKNTAEVSWPVETGPVSILEEENVYRNPSEELWYVRADGETPFELRFLGLLQGNATKNYQIDQMSFLTEADAGTQQFCVSIPKADTVSGEDVTYDRGMEKTVTKPEYFLDAAYTKAVRGGNLRTVRLEQKFLLDSSQSGRKFTVIPKAAAGETQSDYLKDRFNSLTLIADGEAPEIAGLEDLAGLETIDRDTQDISLILTASDSLSGLQEMKVFIQNTDNYCERTYTADASGRIEIDITQEDYLFSGDFSLVITAVDNVGNVREESYNATEFYLQADLVRMREPHDPVFKGGDSGIVTFHAGGYVDRVTVTFPDAINIPTEYNDQSYNHTYEYEVPNYLEEDSIQFMIPLYTENKDYTIVVTAYKDGQGLKTVELPFTVEGKITDEFRTRLRIPD